MIFAFSTLSSLLCDKESSKSVCSLQWTVNHDWLSVCHPTFYCSYVKCMWSVITDISRQMENLFPFPSTNFLHKKIFTSSFYVKTLRIWLLDFGHYYGDCFYVVEIFLDTILNNWGDQSWIMRLRAVKWHQSLDTRRAINICQPTKNFNISD